MLPLWLVVLLCSMRDSSQFSVMKVAVNRMPHPPAMSSTKAFNQNYDRLGMSARSGGRGHISLSLNDDGSDGISGDKNININGDTMADDDAVTDGNASPNSSPNPNSNANLNNLNEHKTTTAAGLSSPSTSTSTTVALTNNNNNNSPSLPPTFLKAFLKNLRLLPQFLSKFYKHLFTKLKLNLLRVITASVLITGLAIKARGSYTSSLDVAVNTNAPSVGISRIIKKTATGSNKRTLGALKNSLHLKNPPPPTFPTTTSIQSKLQNGFTQTSDLITKNPTSVTINTALIDLQSFLQGPKIDTLILLLATAIVPPICKSVGVSPILGFLGSGMLLGPNAFGVISEVASTEGEIGLLFLVVLRF